MRGGFFRAILSVVSFYCQIRVILKKRNDNESASLSLQVETIIKFSNSFIQDLLQVYEFAEKNSFRF